jgi:chromosome segregation ATPase
MNRSSSMIALSMALFAASSAIAQTQRSGGGETQKIMQQYQQVAAEKTALQAQQAQAKKDLEAAQVEIAALKKERDALKSRSTVSAAQSAQLAQLAAGKESTEKSLEQLKQRTAELVARFREMATNLKEVETDRARLQGDLKERSTAFDKCAADNLGLFEVNTQILDRYEHVGVFTKVGTADPFTKIARTRIENLVDEYRERALQLRTVKKPGMPAQ